MKVVFVGPTLPDPPQIDDIVFRPPAKLGDIRRAVDDGATAIGLIDGVYEQAAAVWHKEILFALDQGVRVLGAASMGALRAAECAPFGMEPIGTIALAYCSGALDDDAAVALVHAPAEFGSQALTEPLVDVWATIDNLRTLAIVAESEAGRLKARAASIGFRLRTIDAIFAGHENAKQLTEAYLTHRIYAKRRDALELLSAISFAKSNTYRASSQAQGDTVLWAQGRPRQAFNV
ncbi:hypothetical protein VW35_07755 [Devosia soli]|uniref:TfuA-like core domain-containing protein n=2 Tax=Devosia soli TaxID=361041 RepID=A0A0F5LE56_9HYPH|nr:hypothetical protein VW35_07755 [Devosia soli]